MAVCKTTQIGEPVLRETTVNVTKFDDNAVQEAILNLTDTMRETDLVGMAAPQIGVSLRIFVTEIRETETRKENLDILRVFINPVITDVSHETKLGWEGCGSVGEAGLFGQVERAKEVTVKYFDGNGIEYTQTFTGLVAVVIQHEMDHLNGVIFTDLANPKTFVGRAYYLEHIKGK